ncbi:MAG: AI-2E family transporter [Acidimicrobiia bacterium]
MANKKSEPSENADLDLDDIGIEISRNTIDLDPRTFPAIIIAIVACGLGYKFLSSIAQTITALVIALLFALALDPVVRKVQYLSFGIFRGVKKKEDHEPKERINRYGAVAIVLGIFVTLLFLIGYFLSPKIIDQAQNFAKDIPATVKGLSKLPIVGKQLGNEHTQEKIKKTLNELPERLSAQGSPLGNIIKSFANGAYLGFLFVIMFIALLLDGPRFVRNIRRLIAPKHRDAADRIARAAYRVIGKYMAGSILVAVLAGLVISISGLILGVPLAPLLGLWITGTNLIPQIGGLLGGAPFVVFGFTKSATTGIICAVIFIVYQQIENHIIQPVVIGKTVKISPPVTMVAALIGVAAGGVLGAMLAVPCVGGAKALAAEFDFPRGSRNRALQDVDDKKDKHTL